MTGVDAMVHAIEAYTSRHQKTRFDNLARHALPCWRAISAPRCTTAEPGGPGKYAAGRLPRGTGVRQRPVAAVHALPTPGRASHSHGLSNSLVLLTVLEFQCPNAAELYAELADIVVGAPVAGSAEAKTAAMIARLRALIDDVALPATLAAAGVDEDKLEKLAEDAMLQQRLLVNNPRDVNYEDALAIYRAAFRVVASRAGPHRQGRLQGVLSHLDALGRQRYLRPRQQRDLLLLFRHGGQSLPD